MCSCTDNDLGFYLTLTQHPHVMSHLHFLNGCSTCLFLMSQIIVRFIVAQCMHRHALTLLQKTCPLSQSKTNTSSPHTNFPALKLSMMNLCLMLTVVILMLQLNMKNNHGFLRYPQPNLQRVRSRTLTSVCLLVNMNIMSLRFQ